MEDLFWNMLNSLTDKVGDHWGHRCIGAGVSSQDNYTVFQTMVRMGRVNNEAPTVVDHLSQLIGSGKYVEEDDKITR